MSSADDLNSTPDSRETALELEPDTRNLSAEQLRLRVLQLEESRDRLEERLAAHARVFYDNPVPAIIYSACDLGIINANAKALELYGYSLEQMCDRKLLQLFAPAFLHNRPGLGAELERPMNSLARVLHRDSEDRELVVNMASFTFDLQGGNTRIVMIENETAHHLAEELLRASEERFRELFENANDVIFLHDLQGRLLEVNRAAEHLTGYSRGEVLGKNFEELIAPEARTIVRDIARAHLGGSAPQHYELPVLSKSGRLLFLEVSTRIMYRRGHPVAIQGIGRDITERKQAQQRLLESSRELQLKNEELSTALHLAKEATQLKEQFLANTSHELRTPMNGIMGMVNLLKMTDLTPDQAEYADAVNQCANDLLTIINDLLDLSQIEARRLSLTDEPFELEESVRNVIKLLSVRASAKDVRLTHELDASLPRYIFGDSVRFRQILMNLVANAVKFTPSGSVNVRLYPVQDGTTLRGEVIDSGIGVADAVRERIFEAFFQADGTTRRRFGGTGLGLTICKQLVEIMGGRIGVNNNHPLRGSTFWFELPLRPAEGLPFETFGYAGSELPDVFH